MAELYLLGERERERKHSFECVVASYTPKWTSKHRNIRSIRRIRALQNSISLFTLTVIVYAMATRTTCEMERERKTNKHRMNIHLTVYLSLSLSSLFFLHNTDAFRQLRRKRHRIVW